MRVEADGNQRLAKWQCCDGRTRRTIRRALGAGGGGRWCNIGGGQFNPETAAFARLAGEADAAAHQLDQAAGDGQADAGSFDILVCQALEGAEDAVDLFGRDAGPGVMDTQAQPAVGQAAGDAHVTIRAVVFDRIGNQVDDHLLEPLAVGAHRQFRRHLLLHSYAAAGGERRDEGQAFLDQAGEPDILDVDHQFAGLDG